MNNGIVQYKPRIKYTVDAVCWNGDNIVDVGELIGYDSYDYSDGVLIIHPSGSSSWMNVSRNDMIVRYPDGVCHVMSRQEFSQNFVEDRDCF